MAIRSVPPPLTNHFDYSRELNRLACLYTPHCWMDGCISVGRNDTMIIIILRVIYYTAGYKSGNLYFLLFLGLDTTTRRSFFSLPVNPFRSFSIASLLPIPSQGWHSSRTSTSRGGSSLRRYLILRDWLQNDFQRICCNYLISKPLLLSTSSSGDKKSNYRRIQVSVIKY